MPNYQQTENGSGVMLDGAVIPADMANRHYRGYLKWVQAGNNPTGPIQLSLADEKAAANARARGEAAAIIGAAAPAAADAIVWSLEEAEGVVAAADTKPLTSSAYPLLAALVGAEGADIAEVALAIVARTEALAALVASVHTQRTAVQIAIAAALNVSAVRVAVTDIDWPAAPTPI